MGVMAFGTIPLFHGGVNHLLCRHLFMTLGAELANIRYGCELMFALYFVTHIAIASGHWSMDEFILSHVCMARCGDAAFLRGILAIFRNGVSTV